MPSWKVSFVDGAFQVADADGALYPLTKGGEPLTRFNEGWLPRGLQTALPPFHVLELEHTDGDSTMWLHDESLEYRANAVLGLSLDEQNRFFGVMEPILRTLYAECVLAQQAAIPSAAHQFDGMLPQTVGLLTAEAIRRTMPFTDVVVLDQLQELNAGYGNGVDALPAAWIARAIEAPSASAQERFDLSERHCDRHVDPATGLVFYVISSADTAETSLFVPQHRVVFVRSRHAFDPLALLLTYYASHTDRAVVLPEVLNLAPEMVVPPPQHGLDEPPEPEDEPEVQPLPQPEPEPHGEHEVGRTVFEAPLAETPAEQHQSYAHDEQASAAPPSPAPVVAEPFDISWHDEALLQDEPLPVERATAYAGTASTATLLPPKQNWWQRLLGLGNP